MGKTPMHISKDLRRKKTAKYLRASLKVIGLVVAFTIGWAVRDAVLLSTMDQLIVGVGMALAATAVFIE